MLLKSQRNQFFQALIRQGLQPVDFNERMGDNWYEVQYSKTELGLKFSLSRKERENEASYYLVERKPGYNSQPDKPVTTSTDEWHNGVFRSFGSWAEAVKREVDAPDLWLETTKAVQLFIAADTLAADRFSIAELGAVQGQLRMLGNSFNTSELPEEAKSGLAELTQTATLKAEVLTKKDWQNWIIGAFTSAIASLKLEEAQIQEVMALVRLAFGGLFLKQ